MKGGFAALPMIKIMGFRRDKVSMQNYKEINGNDYVKDSRTTINETMQSIQSMNSGTAFPTNNLFEGMKCYRTDLKKTYTLTDVENNTWVEDAHAALADEATHAASTTKLQTPRALNLSGAVTADAASFDGTTDATINVKTLDASKLKGTASVSTTGNAATATKLATPRTISLTGNASGSAAFDGTSDVSINVNVSRATRATAADNADKLGGYSLNLSGQGGNYGTVPKINVDGVMEVGKYIDWHATHGGTEDHSSRWTAEDNGTVSVGTINGTLNGNSATATKLANESGNNYLEIDTTTDSWNVLGSNPGSWLKSIRTSTSAPPYSLGNYSAAVAFGGQDTKGIITHAYDAPVVKFAGGAGSTARWKFSIYGGRNNEEYDLNNFPTKTGSGASGTWPISITGNADTVDGYHASDIINRISAANTGGIVAASLTENGYVKFANGLILQWGNMPSPVTFPIAFPTAALNVVATLQVDGDGANMSKNRLYVQTLTTTGFSIQNPQGTYRYYAVGY